MNSAASLGTGERLRLFCALRLPREVVDAIVHWQHRHLAGGRIVPPEQLHLTLAFLGSTRSDRLPDVAAALRGAAAECGPIELELPNRRLRETRRVAMLVLHDLHGTATALAEDLFGRLESLGLYERERRTWLPHITVLRFREHATRRTIEAAPPNVGVFSPSEAAVYHSLLRSAGAQYEVLESVVLGG